MFSFANAASNKEEIGEGIWEVKYPLKISRHKYKRLNKHPHESNVAAFN